MIDLLFAFCAAMSLFVLVWIGSLVKRDASLVDRFWGLAFVVIAGTTLARHASSPRGLAAAIAATVWGLRLSIYITIRNWGHGEDRRYKAMRDKMGDSFKWMSLVTVYTLQAFLATIVSLPVVVAIASPAPIDALAIIGLAIFTIGLSFEVVADTQLAIFLRTAKKEDVMQTGVWSWSRHPNYFGEALLWWGLGLVAVSTHAWVLVGPAVITFMLLRVSGVAMLEKSIGDRRPGYADYARRTSSFIPLPPKR